jgi:hypothetical protein
MVAVAVTVIGVAGLLLAYTQGLSINTARRALAGQAEPASAVIAVEAAQEVAAEAQQPPPGAPPA